MAPSSALHTVSRRIRATFVLLCASGWRLRCAFVKCACVEPVYGYFDHGGRFDPPAGTAHYGILAFGHRGAIARLGMAAVAARGCCYLNYVTPHSQVYWTVLSVHRPCCCNSLWCVIFWCLLYFTLYSLVSCGPCPNEYTCQSHGPAA